MNTLSYSFKILIENLWPNNYNKNSKNIFFTPNEFKNKVPKMNIYNFINYIIKTLHEELNQPEQKDIDDYKIIDKTKKSLIFQNFMKNFTLNNQSLISDLFYSVSCNIVECGNCYANIYNYQIYYFLLFSLEEILEFKSEKKFSSIINEINIYDCFDYYCKISIIDKENLFYCNNCKTNDKSSLKNNLVTGPEILILLLNKEKGFKYNIKIHFFEDINLYNYIEYKETGYIYRLIGVVKHIEKKSIGEDFIAYCKDPISYKWNKYCDKIVNEINNFENEVINYGNPILLFYQKVNFF